MWIFSKIVKLVLGFLCVLAFYFAVSFSLEWLPVTGDIEGGNQHVYIYHDKALLSHTSIIFKVEDFNQAERKAFDSLLQGSHQGYLSFSYGDRDFMMDRGGFEDINLTLAFRGLFLPTDALIKVGHYFGIKEVCQALPLPQKNLTLLKASILKQFKQHEGDFIVGGASHFEGVAYYQAKVPYTLFHTCNTWSGDRLRDAGFTMGAWTPLSHNVISQLH